MRTSGRTPRQRRRIKWTVVALALVAAAVYIGFILVTASVPPA